MSEAPEDNQCISRPTCQNQTLLDGLSKCLFSSRWLNIVLHQSHPSQVAAHPGGAHLTTFLGRKRVHMGQRDGLLFFDSCQNLTGSSCSLTWIKCVVVFWVKYVWTLVLHLCIHIEWKTFLYLSLCVSYPVYSTRKNGEINMMRFLNIHPEGKYL